MKKILKVLVWGLLALLGLVVYADARVMRVSWRAMGRAR